MIHTRCLVLSICFLAACCALPAIAGGEDVTLNGEIEAAEYNEESGSVTSVAVYDMEWGEVLISNEGKGKELLNHVGEVATIKGRLFEIDNDSGYQYEIKVASYVIEESAELDEDTNSDVEE